MNFVWNYCSNRKVSLSLRTVLAAAAGAAAYRIATFGDAKPHPCFTPNFRPGMRIRNVFDPVKTFLEKGIHFPYAAI